MTLQRKATQTTNGKVVYLLKLSDTLTTKLNLVTEDLQEVDSAFSDWKTQLEEFQKDPSAIQPCYWNF